MASDSRTIEILLVEDNPGDVVLIKEALSDAKVRNNLHVVMDGVAAMDFLHGNKGINPDEIRPGLILLDLNLPKKDGREVLKEVKGDSSLKSIPIVVMTTSQAEADIIKAYELQANCYITKPVDFDQLMKVVKSIESFWLHLVQLPPE
ncbi:MAG TPA: response regulator [Candidatus Limnocylindrales bacterium]|nr:response regulator [Candidatus Limnocylindrales bacterium]